jgi:transposase-like protein
MPPVDRNNPKRSKASESTYSLMEFMREFPDDATCLEWLWRNRYSEDGEHAYCPHCEKERSFKRYATKQQRQSWTCTGCGHHLQPTAGTIFHKSSTSLQLWFYAMYIMASTRCGVSAKQLERELGVTYKTAWRMFNLIRNQLMSQDGDKPLSGSVEADETWIGGKLRESERRRLNPDGKSSGPYVKKRETVFGMVERGGRAKATIVPSRYGYTLRSQIREGVELGSTIYTDDYYGYNGVELVYAHHRINHSARVYVSGDIHTQTIEGFFGLVKNGLRGVYHSVSAKWLQGYLNEYAWRYNRRDNGRAMFLDLLSESVSRAR